MTTEKRMKRLRAIRDELARLDVDEYLLRRERDDLARALIEEGGLTWRETAEVAGFANPYIAQILRRRGPHEQEER